MYKKDAYKKTPEDGDLKMIDDITGFSNYSSNMVLNYFFNQDSKGMASIVTTEDNADPVYPSSSKKYLPEVFQPKYIRPADYDNVEIDANSLKTWNGVNWV